MPHNRVSVVGIATGSGLVKTFLYSILYRLALGPTQFPIL
jgi:hypothetical protein